MWYEVSGDLCGDARRCLLDLRLPHTSDHRRSTAARDRLESKHFSKHFDWKQVAHPHTAVPAGRELFSSKKRFQPFSAFRRIMHHAVNYRAYRCHFAGAIRVHFHIQSAWIRASMSWWTPLRSYSSNRRRARAGFRIVNRHFFAREISSANS